LIDVMPTGRRAAGGASGVLLIALAALVVLALGAAAFLLGPYERPSPPRFEVDRSVIDVGEMPSDGVAVVSVPIRNAGGSPLTVASISSSCGCTSGEVGARVIAPGATTYLEVTVDHALMPTEGAFLHAVYLATDDPDHPEAVVEVRGVGTLGGRPAAALQPATALSVTTPTDGSVVVFYNDACSDCLMYIEASLLPALARHGLDDVTLLDYLKEREHRSELNRRNVERGIPFELQSHLMTFVGNDLVLAGHIPTGMIAEALDGPPDGAPLLVYQDKMPEMGQRVVDYKVWDFRGEALQVAIDVPLSVPLKDLDLRVAGPAGEVAERWGAGRLVPLVLVSGLLDGINPCAIAVLLLSLAVLFTLQRSRRQVLLTGAVYVFMIFVAYLGIGLGLFGAIVFSGEQHLAARIGSWLLILLGVVNVKDYFWYGFGPSLSVPKVSHETIKGWLQRATLPSAAVAGFLVGLCTFPCTGGIYVAILGLLSTQTTYWQGLSYLLIYNVMFILPLVVLLLALGNRRSVGALARWQAQNKRMVKGATGVVMVAMGAFILIWFI
jgi:cytochrome c-type biogenesis protein